MPTKLTVFNEALALLAQPLMSTDEDPGEDGDILRGLWDSVVYRCHEKTAWDHAKVRVALARQAATPTFGYDYYYSIPSNCLRILYLSETGLPNDELLDYENEPGKIATNVETVYLTYVSETSIVAIGRWSASFAYYVSTELAMLAAPKLNSSALDTIMKERKKALSDAIGLDATQGPVKLRRMGAWARAARGAGNNREQN